MSRYDDPEGDGWKASRRQRTRWIRRRAGRTGPPRASAWMAVAGWTSGVVVFVLVVAALGAYVKYRTVYDSIRRVDTTGLGKQPPKFTNAENILLLGSDTRSGVNGAIGGHVGCNCSDTVMLLHISPGHHLVTVVSIPRDTMVPILACAAGDGATGQQATPGQLEPINYTLSYGGPICTWKTFADVTGIHVDHFIQLDFTGFEKIINDLGGVNVCLPEPVNDSMSGLHLSAGRHHVMGAQALAWWRTREDLGMGDDQQRIQRDQFLMAALVQGIEHSGLLNSPPKILSVITDAADAMTTDTGLDQTAMLQIADSVRGLSSNSVQFITAPNAPYPPDINKVEFEQPQASELFYAIAHDTKLPKPKAAKSKKPIQATTTPVVDTTPSKVNVEVLNGSGINGLAGEAGSDLTSRGFNVVGTGNTYDNNFSYTNPVIEYASAADKPAVNTLKAQISNVTVEKDASLTPGTIDLIVGSAFSGLASPGSSSSSSSSSSKSRSSSSSAGSVSNLSTAYGGITANTKICSDQSAFAGPDNPGG